MTTEDGDIEDAVMPVHEARRQRAAERRAEDPTLLRRAVYTVRAGIELGLLDKDEVIGGA